MDVSDGLLGDLAKLCAASGVGARLDLECLPVSQELRHRYSIEECEQFVLCGGDDYELLFTVPGHEAPALEQALAHRHALTRIGRVEAAPGVRCMRNGRPVEVRGGGYDHFA
jgi:thiamine-monophosphate kinase